MVKKLLYRIYRLFKESYDAVYNDGVAKRYQLDPSVKLGPGVSLMGRVEIGANTYINGPGIVFGGKQSKVKIGAWCAIANNVSLRSETHDLNQPTGPNMRMVEADIVIGDYVWVGANVFIKSGVTVGDHAVIGANSVVTKDVAPHTVVAGVPAKEIGVNRPAAQVEG